MTNFLESEETVLGACLRDQGLLARAISAGISPASFDEPENREVFIALLKAERAGAGHDLANLVALHPEKAGKLYELWARAPVSLNIEPFIRGLKGSEWQRHAAEALSQLQRLVARRKPLEPIDDLKVHIASVLDKLTASQDSSRGPKKAIEILEELLPEIEKQILDRGAGKPAGITTGFEVLDLVTGGGFGPGSINVAAARTGQGKTTLALNFLHAASLAGYGCAYFTVEMPNKQIMLKLLSRIGKIHGTKLMIGDLTDLEIERLMVATREISPRPIWVDDSTEASFEAFEFACRKLKRQGKLDLVVVDYVQQFTLPGRWQSPTERVAAVSHRLKQLALKLEIAVVALAQLNREAEKGDCQPDVWHIKDSGAIEQDADLIVLIHHDGTACQLFVGKNRHGRDRFGFPVEANLAFNEFRELNLNVEAFK